MTEAMGWAFTVGLAVGCAYTFVVAWLLLGRVR